jgi:CHAD domain-containing protein
MGPGFPYLATTAQGQDGNQRDNDGLRQTHPHAATLPTAHQRDTERGRLQQFRPGEDLRG